MKLDKVETFNYEGDVYNLELKTNDPAPDHDDLYWVDANTGLVTHNCFPKDLTGMIYFAKDMNVSSSFLKQVIDSNNDYRKNKDWLKMKGRAISED
jgi:hypothetical protein